MSVTQVALCFALRYQFTLELLTGDLATNQACQCAKSSVSAVSGPRSDVIGPPLLH